MSAEGGEHAVSLFLDLRFPQRPAEGLAMGWRDLSKQQRQPLDREALTKWLERATVRLEPSPSGRRLLGTHPTALPQAVDHLASAIRTLPSTWLAPHFRIRP
ncbi:MAG: hypothetical protein ACI8RZ_005446 [Myxococcota bacterium]|jgi:hypothetical protein